MDTDLTEPDRPRPDAADEGSAFGPVGVVGAGAMGAGIAQVAATAGHAVVLVDALPGAAAGAVERIGAALTRLVEKGRLPADEANAVLARITPAESLDELPNCGLVIEAVPEDLDLKRRIFADLADRQPSTTVLATNTSSIDIDDIAADVADPERVLGLHFFNPPPVMKLVEVVHGERTAQAYVEHATALMTAWGKTPVRCSSTPGFIVNRVARPFYGEAQRIVESGVADAATVDWILRERGGFPMGPLELTDFIGQDVNLAVGTSVWEQTGRDERYTPTTFQQDLVAAGRLGRKSGSGCVRVCRRRLGRRGRARRRAGASASSADRSRPTRSRGRSRCSSTRPSTSWPAVRRAPTTSTRRCGSARDTRRAPSRGGARSGSTSSPASSPSSTRPIPGGRYRPSPALTDGSLT